jgi:hypothetical protein
MAETVNIGEVAPRVAEEIFKHFFWTLHPKHDQNFKCLVETHLTEGKKPKQKTSHPADAVFSYLDPYTGRRTFLHTDFKSYGKESIGPVVLRTAIKSLAMSVECAKVSKEWRTIYSVNEEEEIDIHGFLFVYNHDKRYADDFSITVSKANLASVDIAPHVYIHYFGPQDINRIWSICNDLMRLKYEKTLPELYSFYYADLFMWHLHGDVWNQPATIETLAAPYFIIKYRPQEKSPGGYLIYYNRSGSTVDEFEYFLDSLSRFQMLNTDDMIRVRISHTDPDENYNSNFLAAKSRYAKLWGFDVTRQTILDGISIQPLTSVTSTFSAGNLGWKERK